MDGEGEHSNQAFPLKLVEYAGNKVEQFSFTNETPAREVERSIRGAAGGGRTAPVRCRCSPIDRKQRRRNPAPPFTTSTLQQEAARKLGFNASRTMRLAQQLYEGVDIGEGSVGLITYMRTDSVSLAAEAVSEIRQVAASLYGADAIDPEPRFYKTKSKNAQEAHEAVRPTSASHRAGGHRALPGRRSVQAVLADLEARRRLPDDARDVRHRRRGHARRTRWTRAAPAARQWLHPDQARLHRRVPGRGRRRQGR